MTYDELRTEFNNPSFKQNLISVLGCKCYNCGSEDNVEYHHVVPLALGGTNGIKNIVPLCYSCHKAAHRGRHVSEYIKKSELTGRPQKMGYEEAEPILDEYISGRIGMRECKTKLGYAPGSHISDRKIMKEFLKRHNISKYRNNIDVKVANGNLSPGDKIGYIVYADGRRAETRYGT